MFVHQAFSHMFAPFASGFGPSSAARQVLLAGYHRAQEVVAAGHADLNRLRVLACAC
jgi:hypothetical protein